MNIHELKIWPEYLTMIEQGTKRFEWRKNDRDFHTGDLLFLREWEPTSGKYQKRSILVRIDSMIGQRGEFEITPGYVIMSITPVKIVLDKEAL